MLLTSRGDFRGNGIFEMRQLQSLVGGDEVRSMGAK